MTNRVDELESQVEKLQATVNGLTEELVEAKERIRLLEESVDVDLTTGTRSVGHDPDISAEGRADDSAAETEATVNTDTQPVDGGSDPLAESQAQTASRSRTSDTPSDDASFIDAGSDDSGSANPEPEATQTATPDADGTKTDGDESTDDVTIEDDDIIVA